MHMYVTSALQRTDMKAVGLQLALDLLHEKVGLTSNPLLGTFFPLSCLCLYGQRVPSVHDHISNMLSIFGPGVSTAVRSLLSHRVCIRLSQLSNDVHCLENLTNRSLSSLLVHQAKQFIN